MFLTDLQPVLRVFSYFLFVCFLFSFSTFLVELTGKLRFFSLNVTRDQELFEII